MHFMCNDNAIGQSTIALAKNKKHSFYQLDCSLNSRQWSNSMDKIWFWPIGWERTHFEEGWGKFVMVKYIVIRQIPNSDTCSTLLKKELEIVRTTPNLWVHEDSKLAYLKSSRINLLSWSAARLITHSMQYRWAKLELSTTMWVFIGCTLPTPSLSYFTAIVSKFIAAMWIRVCRGGGYSEYYIIPDIYSSFVHVLVRFEGAQAIRKKPLSYRIWKRKKMQRFWNRLLLKVIFWSTFHKKPYTKWNLWCMTLH